MPHRHIEPLTPKECVDVAFRRICHLMCAAGVCESCALKLVAYEIDVPYHKLLMLWLDRTDG